MMYCVDLVSKVTRNSVLTILKTDSHSRAWEVASNYNEIHGNTEDEIEMLNNEDTEGWTPHPYWATVYNDYNDVIEPKFEEVKEMKKYTIEEAKEFCRDVLEMPPVEQFESGEIDESEWFNNHKIHIIIDGNDMELEYNADNVNELDDALIEMYEVEMDIRSATTGNTVGSEYRPAELKDIIRIAIQNDWHDWGWKMGDFGVFIREFINRIKDISDVMRYYKVIQEDYKDATDLCKCDFKTLDMSTMRINPKTIRDAVDSLIGTDRELLYGITHDNKSSDIVFVMDYSLKPLGAELIGWFYGEPDDEYIDGLFADYKKKLFGEEV